MAGGFKALKGQGHWPTLFAAFLYFDFSFMVWTMLGPLSTEIAESLQMSQNFMMTPSQKATLLSIPILAGALLRIVLGFGVDKFGAKKRHLRHKALLYPFYSTPISEEMALHTMSYLLLLLDSDLPEQVLLLLCHKQDSGTLLNSKGLCLESPEPEISVSL